MLDPGRLSFTLSSSSYTNITITTTKPTAFIQGVGYYLHEDVRFDDQGRLLTTGTWLYKPPSALDIPLEFNVCMCVGLRVVSVLWWEDRGMDGWMDDCIDARPTPQLILISIRQPPSPNR